MVSVKLRYLRKYINFDILYWLSFKKWCTLLFSLLLLWQSIWDNLKEEKLCFRSQFCKLLVWWWLESTSLGLRWGKGSHSHIRGANLIINGYGEAAKEMQRDWERNIYCWPVLYSHLTAPPSIHYLLVDHQVEISASAHATLKDT